MNAAILRDMLEAQRAIDDARKRGVSRDVGVRVLSGRMQVVRVTYAGRRAAGNVEPLTGWLPLREAVAAIEALR